MKLVIILCCFYYVLGHEDWDFFNSLVSVLKDEKNSHTCLYSDDFSDVNHWDRIYLHFGPLQLAFNTSKQSELNIFFSKNTSFYTDSIRNSKIWKSSNFYIFLSIENSTLAEYIIKYLWYNYEVYNAFILNDKSFKVFDPTCKSVMHFYSFEPEDVKEFFKTRLMDWHGSLLYAVSFERESSLKITNNGVKGFEGQLYTIIRDKLNFEQVRLVNTSNKSRYGTKYKNGTLGGTFKNLVEKTANITAIGHFIKWYGVPELTFTHYISSENLCIFISKSGKVSHIFAFMKSLKITTLLGCVVLYVMADMALIGLNKIECKLRRIRSTFVRPFFMVFRIILGIPINMSVLKSYERFILSSMFLMSFIIANVFQSSLMTFSSAPLYIKNLDTINELKAAKIEVWLSSLEISTSLMNDKSLSGLKIVRKPEVEMLLVNQRDDIGCTLRLNVFLSPNFWDYNGEKTDKDKPKHIVGECIGTYFVALALPSGSPFEKPINKIIVRAIESGITKKWILNQANNHEAGVLLKTNEIKYEMKPLTKNDILIALVLYFFGILLSLIVFIVEMIVRMF